MNKILISVSSSSLLTSLTMLHIKAHSTCRQSNNLVILKSFSMSNTLNGCQPVNETTIIVFNSNNNNNVNNKMMVLESIVKRQETHFVRI